MSPATAALLGGLFGLMQLPGRAWLMNRQVALPGETLVVVSLVMQAVGFFAIVVSASVAVVAVGALAFAIGSGLTALARPLLVQTRFRLEHGAT